MRRNLLRPPLALFLPKGACIFCQAARLLPSHVARPSSSRPISRIKPPKLREKPKDPKQIWQQQIALAKNAQEKDGDGTVDDIADARADGAPLPEAVFKTAYADGFLPMKPETCFTLRRRFEVFRATATVEEFQRLLKSLDINVDHLVPLCRILLKARNTHERNQGSMLLMMACRAGSRAAVIWNLKMALKQGQFNHNNLKAERQQLLALVKEGTYVPALMLQAHTYLSAGNIGAAMKLWSRVTKLPEDVAPTKADESGLLDSEETGLADLDVCSAWIAIGRECMDIHSEHYDFDRGKEAFRVAAIQYDDPYAYHRLARIEDLYSPLWIEYHTKAAASGHRSSASALGKFYSLPLEELEATLQEPARDPVLRQEVLDEFLRNPCYYGWKPLVGSSEQDEAATKRAAVQRARYAIVWHDIAFNAGHEAAALDRARLLWFCGDYIPALTSLYYARTRDFSKAGEECHYLNRDAQVLFRQWQKEDIWKRLYAEDEAVRTLHAEISKAKEFVRVKLESGFKTRNPALKKMQREEREAKSHSH